MIDLPAVADPGRRRCRRRPIDPGSPRPSELLRVFFLAGLAFIALAVLAAVANGISERDWLHRLALHLLFLGGISQLVLGAGQFFTCAFLATDPPPRGLIAAQLLAWNGGTVLVAVGVSAGQVALVYAGAVAVGSGLVLFALGLRRMERRSLQHVPWALRWYRAATACLGLGALIGVLMARGTIWTHGDLLGAHLALNLAGWLGTAIIGTLHTFFPSLTQTQLHYPRLQRPTYVLWLLGVVELAIGAAFTSRAVLATGWTDLLAATALLCLNLVASLRAAPGAVSLPARLLAVGQTFLLGGLAVALVSTIQAGADGPFSGSTREVLAVLLLAGWIGLTVAGSLLHLLAILARIRRFAVSVPRPHPAVDRRTTVAAAVAVTALAFSEAAPLGSLRIPAAGLTLVVISLLVLRLIPLAARALMPRARNRHLVRPPERLAE